MCDLAEVPSSVHELRRERRVPGRRDAHRESLHPGQSCQPKVRLFHASSREERWRSGCVTRRLSHTRRVQRARRVARSATARAGHRLRSRGCRSREGRTRSNRGPLLVPRLVAAFDPPHARPAQFHRKRPRQRVRPRRTQVPPRGQWRDPRRERSQLLRRSRVYRRERHLHRRALADRWFPHPLRVRPRFPMHLQPLHAPTLHARGCGLQQRSHHGLRRAKAQGTWRRQLQRVRAIRQSRGRGVNGWCRDA